MNLTFYLLRPLWYKPLLKSFEFSYLYIKSLSITILKGKQNRMEPRQPIASGNNK